ncbi:hypothetical protein [Heyndrickxia vini]|uniref:Uncharacterized protein n=1 Tax=Heyndrickxia vini TaxID=1476025 RepID=A0ABX7E3W4_9BACI|nr:hypothetical protein [Heyndrickxia vini]QQZ10005.1 hypothetical protein I5776_03285 [Heyndrickxia vini]
MNSWKYPDESVLYVSYSETQGTVTQLINSLRLSDSKADLKVFPAESTIDNEEQFNSVPESFNSDPVLNSGLTVGLVKVVVKAEDGTLREYVVVERNYRV